MSGFCIDEEVRLFVEGLMEAEIDQKPDFYHKIISSFRRQYLSKLIEKYKSQVVLADKMNVSRNTLRRWFDKEGVTYSPIYKGQRKFTSDDVQKIRRLYDTGSFTIQKLADENDASFQTIQKIVNRKSYKDVT